MAALRSGRSVKIVVIKRAAYMRKVHAYLVGAPRVQRKFRKRHVFICKKHAVIGAGIFAAFADAALNYAAFLAGNRRLNNAICGRRKFCCNARVFFYHLLLRKQKLDARLLGKNNKPGSIAVEP